ncbi:hypothetical protein SAMN05428971_2927 [Candidatus Pantoea varia]|uniref:Uncharacterized protein n=1 Tax=Candidatus Pantoea varia TaxID=1881036 RepID=A0A1I5EHU0_9GAMM|nr:hypothetical protein SAMN05428971_2927 [Pantoea varia]
MISGTLLAVIFVPAFFIFVMTLNEKITHRIRKLRK